MSSRLFAKRAARPLALLAIALLSGCADRQSIEVGAIPDDYRTRHPIVVGDSQEKMEIPVVSSEIRLSLPVRERVAYFAGRFLRSGSAAIRIMVPSGSDNGASARLAAGDVAHVLRRAGVKDGRILMQPYNASGSTGPTPIRLSYATLKAETAPCGRWPEDLGDTNENKNYYNFGCANQQNLAAQISDPRDLLEPRGMSEIDAGRRTDMLDKYRNGENTASEPSRTESTYTW